MNLEGKVALVLGAIKGIGKGIALALAQGGVKVAATYFDWEDEYDSFQEDLAAFGTDHLIVQINLREFEKIPELIEKVIHRFGHLDILINNIERGGWPIVHGPYVEEQWNLELETTLYIIKDAPFMTGCVLRLDGGYVLGGEKVGEMPEGIL